MKRLSILIGILFLSLALTGCVQTKDILGCWEVNENTTLTITENEIITSIPTMSAEERVSYKMRFGKIIPLSEGVASARMKMPDANTLAMYEKGENYLTLKRCS